MYCRNADLFFSFTGRLLEITVLKIALTHIQKVVFCDNDEQEFVIIEKWKLCRTC